MINKPTRKTPKNTPRDKNFDQMSKEQSTAHQKSFKEKKIENQGEDGYFPKFDYEEPSASTLRALETNSIPYSSTIPSAQKETDERIKLGPNAFEEVGKILKEMTFEEFFAKSNSVSQNKKNKELYNKLLVLKYTPEKLYAYEKSRLVNAMRPKLLPMEIIELEKAKKSFSDYVLWSTILGFANSFMVTSLSKKFFKIRTSAQLLVSFSVFTGSLLINLSPAMMDLNGAYLKLIRKHSYLLDQYYLSGLLGVKREELDGDDDAERGFGPGALDGGLESVRKLQRSIEEFGDEEK